jgi:hypothetical protein
MLQEFAKKFLMNANHMSACAVASTSMIVVMSGVDSIHLVAINGCRNGSQTSYLERG